MEKKKCRRCGHAWAPRKNRPMACPACKSYHYEKPIVRFVGKVEE